MKHLLFYSIIVTRLKRSPAARLYTMYIALSGVIWSILQFGEVIARKSLNASEIGVTLLVMLMPIGALTSLWWARLVEGRDQRRLLIIVGSIGYLALATGSMLFTIQHMLVIHLVFFLSSALYGPSENRILQQHVASKKTGQTFGNASSIRMGVVALASIVFGWWMEHQEGAYRSIYPIAALAGVASMILLASIRTGGKNTSAPVRLDRKFIFSPVRDVVKLLKRRKDYLRFEIAFMFYGVAFMMILPVIPLFLVDDLELGYDTIGMARGAAGQILGLLTMPLFGRFFDKSTPHRMATVIFMMLAGFPLLLLSAKYFSGDIRLFLIYLTFGYFGVVMSGVMVLWQLSSIRFSGGDDAGIYQSVHVAATGIRGAFVPLMGYFAMTHLGKIPTLWISSAIYFSAGLMMILMRRIDFKQGDDSILRAE